MSYDLRRLRLHGVIERLTGTHRYRLTNDGIRIALFFTRAHARLLRPALSIAEEPTDSGPRRRDPTATALSRLQTAFDHLINLCRFKAA